jgi:hypothetical protein
MRLAGSEAEEDRHHAQGDRRDRESTCAEEVTYDAEQRPNGLQRDIRTGGGSCYKGSDNPQHGQ